MKPATLPFQPTTVGICYPPDVICKVTGRAFRDALESRLGPQTTHTPTLGMYCPSAFFLPREPSLFVFRRCHASAGCRLVLDYDEEQAE